MSIILFSWPPGLSMTVPKQKWKQEEMVREGIEFLTDNPFLFLERFLEVSAKE